MNSFKYLAYGTVWIGVLLGACVYSLLAGVFGIEAMYAAVGTFFAALGVLGVLFVVFVVPLLAAMWV